MIPYIVVDASIAGAWLFSEQFTSEAKPVLEALVAQRVIGLAPDRFEEELLRICQKKTLPPPEGAGLSPDQCFDRFQDLMTSPIPFYLLPSQELHEQAWEMATTIPKLTTHDALYLALAKRWSAELWTADSDLAGQDVRTVYGKIYDIRSEPFSH